MFWSHKKNSKDITIIFTLINYVKLNLEIFFRISWASQNIRTLYISLLKFRYSKKATKLGDSFFILLNKVQKATKLSEIFTLLLSYALPVKSKLKILQNFVAFSEYMNFTRKNLKYRLHHHLSKFGRSVFLNNPRLLIWTTIHIFQHR